ncbi:RAQPRD family integrative conjugative element protein [Chelonobacter oris]|uniref:integrative conjugative element protein, RAQPRD family n=1 Tax=Chelonobacter oris TaxID=505317 RepID=UPI002447CCD7|nr:RAQPRD family integrative conjugative element protein [Chelonobacter oris]
MVFVLSLGLISTGIHASEQEQLAQAIKQLDAAQLSLQRARQAAHISAKSREYFDYSAAQRDINTVKHGIQHYISPSRAIPRNPNALRSLHEDYIRLRAE